LPNVAAGHANAGAVERSIGVVTAARLAPLARVATSDGAARYFS
jgi:hypothetical protein